MKKKLTLVSIVMIVVLLCLSSAVFAWVTINNALYSRNQQMTIMGVSDVATLSTYALRYDGTIGAVCYKIGDGAGEVLDVEMTEFDRIFRDRSVNTPLIYVVELANVPDSSGYYINVKIPCSEEFLRFANNTTTNNYEDDGNTAFVVQRYISNIVSVKVGCGGPIPQLTPTTTSRVENNVTVFQTQKTAFQSITSGSAVGKFATVTDETSFSKSSSVQLILPQSVYHSSIYTAENDQGVMENRLMLYIQIDYDNDLMDAFIQHMMDDSEGDVSFADDLGIIQILVRTGGN